MQLGRAFVILGSAAACLAASATAAAASGPPVSLGCTFVRAADAAGQNGTTGVETCTSRSEDSLLIGPFSTNGVVPGTTTFDGITGADICRSFFGEDTPFTNWVSLDDVLLNVHVLTVTTTQRHGLHGAVFNTTTATYRYVFNIAGGGFGCGV